MHRFSRLSFLTLAILAAPAAAFADDAELAAKLVGTWEGRWTFGDAGGKLVVTIKAAAGNALKGDSTWYDTAVGDHHDTFSKATIKGFKLAVREEVMDFEATVAADGTAIDGTWTSPMASGPLSLKKKPN
jgi:hypothetical protein